MLVRRLQPVPIKKIQDKKIPSFWLGIKGQCRLGYGLVFTI